MRPDYLLHRTDEQLKADYKSLDETIDALRLDADEAQDSDELRQINADGRDAAEQWDEVRHSLTLRGYKFSESGWIKA